MPRSRSSAFESITRSINVSLARKTPLWRSMASTSVVLPWSTWAMIAMLRTSVRRADMKRGSVAVGGRVVKRTRIATRTEGEGRRRPAAIETRRDLRPFQLLRGTAPKRAKAERGTPHRSPGFAWAIASGVVCRRERRRRRAPAALQGTPPSRVSTHPERVARDAARVRPDRRLPGGATARGPVPAAGGLGLLVQVWAFVDVDEPVSPPALPQEPRPGRSDGRRGNDRFDGYAPAIKRSRRGAGIQPAHVSQMLPNVVENVHESVPYLAGLAQQVRVVSVGPYATMASEDAIHRLREPDRQAAYAVHEPHRLVRFHQQVQMVGLDAVMENAEPIGACGGQRASGGIEEAPAPERGEPRAETQRDVGGTMTVMWRACAMRNGAASGHALAARAFAAAAPGASHELELFGMGLHLIRADIIAS